MINQLVTKAGVEQPLGQRHAHGIGDALTQRAGGGLDSGQVAMFGMAGGGTAHFAEMFSGPRW